MKIEVLYFDGCPNHEALLPHLRRPLEQAGVSSPVELVNVPDDVAATHQRFLGSPTLRIDGRDVEPGAGAAGASTPVRMSRHDCSLTAASKRDRLARGEWSR